MAGRKLNITYAQLSNEAEEEEKSTYLLLKEAQEQFNADHASLNEILGTVKATGDKKTPFAITRRRKDGHARKIYLPKPPKPENKNDNIFHTIASFFASVLTRHDRAGNHDFVAELIDADFPSAAATEGVLQLLRGVALGFSSWENNPAKNKPVDASRQVRDIISVWVKTVVWQNHHNSAQNDGEMSFVKEAISHGWVVNPHRSFIAMWVHATASITAKDTVSVLNAVRSFIEETVSVFIQREASAVEEWISQQKVPSSVLRRKIALIRAVTVGKGKQATKQNREVSFDNVTKTPWVSSTEREALNTIMGTNQAFLNTKIIEEFNDLSASDQHKYFHSYVAKANATKTHNSTLHESMSASLGHRKKLLLDFGLVTENKKTGFPMQKVPSILGQSFNDLLGEVESVEDKSQFIKRWLPASYLWSAKVISEIVDNEVTAIRGHKRAALPEDDDPEDEDDREVLAWSIGKMLYADERAAKAAKEFVSNASGVCASIRHAKTQGTYAEFSMPNELNEADQTTRLASLPKDVRQALERYSNAAEKLRAARIAEEGAKLEEQAQAIRGDAVEGAVGFDDLFKGKGKKGRPSREGRK